MAKISRFTTTRISAALNADYTQNENVKDCFYLDGRLTRKREKNGADISSTGEDRGFFYSIFASHDLAAVMDENSSISSLDQMTEAVKRSNDAIDNEINDLADCAVEVGGKSTITRPGVRQSYFAGIIVKEGEIAAVARGGACALLFRNNALYPLTSCDIELINADYHGNRIEHMMDFSAGVAGTIRYSNIAQVQNNDVLILCNKELLEAVGQRKLLDILYHTEDCGDAAAEIVDHAREENQDDSLQIILAAVEEVIPADRTGRINLGLFQNQDNNLASQETTRYEPLRSEGVKPADETDDAFKPEYPITQKAPQKTEESEAKNKDFTEETEKVHEESQTTPDYASWTDEDDADDPFKPHAEDFASLHDQQDEQQDNGFDFSDLEEQEVTSVEQNDLDDVPVFEPIVTPKSKRASSKYAEDDEFVDHAYLPEDDAAYHDDDDAWQDDRKIAASRENNDFADQDYDDEYDYYEEKQPASNVKRNIIYVVLILICLACLFALAKMLFFNDKKPGTDTTKSETASVSAQEVHTTNESDVKTPIKKSEPSEKMTEPSESKSNENPDEEQPNDEEPGQQQGLFSGTMYVNTETLNLRAAATTESDIVTQLAEGEILEIIESAGDGWYYVRTTEGYEGYVLGDYLRD